MPQIEADFRIAFLGLPLAACLLAKRGFRLDLVALAPVPAPGRRRLRRLIRHVTPIEGASAHAEQQIFEQLRALKPDLIVSWFWTRRIPSTWLAQAKWGGIGVHPSLLPRHRGPDPFFWAIDAADPFSGVSVHRLDAEYDTGNILLQESLAIGERNAWQLARALDRPGIRLLLEAVRRIAQRETLPERVQNEADATWAPAPSGAALKADFGWPTARVLRKIRALAPIPGLALEFRGIPLCVTQAEPSTQGHALLLPGEAAVLGSPPALVIRTADGSIAITAATLEVDDADTVIEIRGAELAAFLQANAINTAG